MITERTLRKWRADALNEMSITEQAAHGENPEGLTIHVLMWRSAQERILRLTAELIDLHLMKGRKS